LKSLKRFETKFNVNIYNEYSLKHKKDYIFVLNKNIFTYLLTFFFFKFFQEMKKILLFEIIQQDIIIYIIIYIFLHYSEYLMCLLNI
jgi:hypothetical protein